MVKHGVIKKIVENSHIKPWFRPVLLESKILFSKL